MHSIAHPFRVNLLFLVVAFSFLSSSFSRTSRRTGNTNGCWSPEPATRLLTADAIAPPADFIVTVNANLQWVINGQVNPTLNLVRGQTYTFDLTAFGDEHPFVVNSNASNPFGIAYAGQAFGSVLNFTPNNFLPSTIFYHCTVHYGSMAGSIHLSGPQLVCSGDLNGDLSVNSSDFGLFVAAFGTNCTGCLADLDGNGTVNSSDFGLFVAAFGSSCA